MREIDVTKIGQRIKFTRVMMGVSQTKLANLLFIAQQTLSQYETGKVEPSLSILIKLSEVSKMDINWFLFGELKL